MSSTILNITFDCADPNDNRPEFGWVTLADPEGNEFDLEPGGRGD